jgi:alpha-amylase
VLGDWSSGFSLNYGWLVGLADLNTERPYVQQRIADYFTDLLGIGFSGFRIDAAKHIQPDDLAAILGKFRDNLGTVSRCLLCISWGPSSSLGVGGTIPDDWLTYLEVIIGGEKDLLECQYQYYQYSLYFNDALKKNGFSDADIAKACFFLSVL